jgi:ABC-2 type transport system permease protein
VARGQSADEAMAQLQPITVDAYMLSNPWANYSVYLSTTLLPNMLQVFILLLTVYCICIELKQKTSQEWMATAGGSITKALIGKLLPYTITFSLLGIMGNIILFGWLDFPIQTNIFSMLTASVLYVLAYQGWGVLIAGLIQRMSSCITVASLLGALALTLSGLTFPIMAMPSFATGWSHLLPIRHYLVIYTNQALNGFGFANCWTSYLALIFFALLPLTVGKRLKKELLNPTVEQ